ncbi:DUF3231 family protein [Clostridium tagluense]|uniref:DUF3231 family protein n=1 Tax=Clostridium tagluense TaxID=360422 RepID=UPI001CF263AC|nr:DUF3231 family protein [Clostridium tagluense]MCB2298702.1 DUF3231 family protein [Clostridium tagluense]
MVTPIKNPITSSELGTLWMTYQRKKMMRVLIGHLAYKSENEEAKKILFDFTEETEKYINEIEKIFTAEKAAFPIAFDDNDVFNDAPPLFEDMFNIIFLRLLMKMDMGANSLNLSMAYRKDIREFYKRSSIYSQDIYDLSTDFLLERGILARPPYVTMPKKAEFVEEKKYMSGINLFGEKRALNTIEVGFMVQSLEFNIFGMQLMTGFAQVAKESEIKKYFIKGKELSKKIVTQVNGVLLQSDIQPPSTWAGNATNSTMPPFSDKIMMFLTNLISIYALGYNALGVSFSLRSDLPAKLLFVEKDTFSYANEGGKLMIKHKWLEEPPQMDDRNELTKSKE